MRLFTVYALVSFAVAKSTSSLNSVKSAISTASAQASAASASASAASLSPCALACITDAAAASPCNVPTNLTCVCTDPDFQAMSNSCLTAECLPSEAGVALGLQAAECGPLSATAAPTGTGPFTPTNSFADISSGSSSSTASGLASGPGSSPSAASVSESGSGSSSPSTASSPAFGSGSSPFPTASGSAPGSGSSSPSTTGATVALLSPQSTMGLMLAMGIAVVGGLVGGIII